MSGEFELCQDVSYEPILKPILVSDRHLRSQELAVCEVPIRGRPANWTTLARVAWLRVDVAAHDCGAREYLDIMLGNNVFLQLYTSSNVPHKALLFGHPTHDGPGGPRHLNSPGGAKTKRKACSFRCLEATACSSWPLLGVDQRRLESPIAYRLLSHRYPQYGPI